MQTALRRETLSIKTNSVRVHPLLASVASGLCLPGLGQFLAGQRVKGVVLTIGILVLVVIWPPILLVLWTLTVVDAYLIARKVQSGHAVQPWEFF